MDRRRALLAASQMSGGNKIENKCTASINRLDMVVLSFDYPVESDLTITWDIGEIYNTETVAMSKGSQSGIYSRLNYKDSNNLQSYIKSITPSEDEVYKYTF